MFPKLPKHQIHHRRGDELFADGGVMFNDQEVAKVECSGVEVAAGFIHPSRMHCNEDLLFFMTTCSFAQSSASRFHRNLRGITAMSKDFLSYSCVMTSWIFFSVAMLAEANVERIDLEMS
jgi:hypothetical protein